MRKKSLIMLSAAMMLASCATDPNTGERITRRTAIGAGGGAAVGAGVGTLFGGNDARNAAIGAAVGALAGGAVGLYMDRQEARLRQATVNTGVEVQRVGEQIQLTMPASVAFETGQTDVQPRMQAALNDIAATLQAYPSTAVDIIGHADASGSFEQNQALSEERAKSVQLYLLNQNVRPVRLTARGRGDTRPIASNETAEGRARNRRVEIVLTPVVEQSA